MKLRTILAAAAVGAVAAATPVALAQTPDPISGGTKIGGTVPSFLELILTQPTTGFTTFTKAKTYTTSFDVAVTTTDTRRCSRSPTARSRAAPSSAICRAAPSGCRSPLEARVGKAAFQPLDAPVDPLLTSGASRRAAKATVNLRQKVKAKATGQLPQGRPRHAFHGDAVVGAPAQPERNKEIPEVKLARSRLVAGALGLAVAGTATGGVIAQRGRLRAARRRPPSRAASRSRPPPSRRPPSAALSARSRSRTRRRTRCGSPSTCARGSRTAPPARVVLNTRASLSPYVRRQPADVQPASRASARVKLNMERMTASRLALRRLPGVRQAGKAKAPQRDHPAVGAAREAAPEPVAQEPEPALGATDVVGRGDGRSLILAVRNTGNTLDPVGGTVTHHRPDGAQRHDPAGRRRPRPGRLPQGRRAARHEGRQLHRHVERHAGRQALQRQAHLRL